MQHRDLKVKLKNEQQGLAHLQEMVALEVGQRGALARRFLGLEHYRPDTDRELPG